MRPMSKQKGLRETHLLSLTSGLTGARDSWLLSLFSPFFPINLLFRVIRHSFHDSAISSSICISSQSISSAHKSVGFPLFPFPSCLEKWLRTMFVMNLLTYTSWFSAGLFFAASLSHFPRNDYKTRGLHPDETGTGRRREKLFRFLYFLFAYHDINFNQSEHRN